MAKIEIDIDEVASEKIENLERQLKAKRTECKNKADEILRLNKQIEFHKDNIAKIKECSELAKELIKKLEGLGIFVDFYHSRLC